VLNVGCGRVLRRVDGESKRNLKRIVVRVDNVGVLKRSRKGKGFCGEGEQLARKMEKRLLSLGWEICLEWVPGHVGIEENEEVYILVKEAVWEEKDRRIGGVLSWGEWGSRRKRLERVRWREYWRKKRKEEEYFGSGEGGESGEDKEAWFSRVLVWMRTNHGLMDRATYKEWRKCCREVDDRDYIFLRCGRWWEERWKMWKEVYYEG